MREAVHEGAAHGNETEAGDEERDWKCQQTGCRRVMVAYVSRDVLTVVLRTSLLEDDIAWYFDKEIYLKRVLVVKALAAKLCMIWVQHTM